MNCKYNMIKMIYKIYMLLNFESVSKAKKWPNKGL